MASRGSVIPLFDQQISNGGPITVTDPNATRYFMSIQEASQLIIQCGTFGKDGEIFLLEMGKKTIREVSRITINKKISRLSLNQRRFLTKNRTVRQPV